MKDKAFIKNFSMRLAKYFKDEVLVTRLLAFSDEGEVSVGYTLWKDYQEKRQLQTKFALGNLTFEEFISLSPKIIIPTPNEQREYKDAITRVYPEANASTFDRYSFVLEGASFKAWWETEGKFLKLKTLEIDMSKVNETINVEMQKEKVNETKEFRLVEKEQKV